MHKNSKLTLSLYRKLLLVRLAEEKIREEYPYDAIKTPVHLANGSEAISVGVSSVLPPDSKVFGTYRNHGLYLSLTDDTDSFFAELYGKAVGCAKGKAGSMHLSYPEKDFIATSAIVGTTIPLAVGAALANNYRNSNDIAVAFFGDGALEEGVFWESLNFACLKKLKTLFVCEDNGLAIHAQARERRGFKSIPDAIRGFDCHVASGDGTDLSSVSELTQSALKLIAEDPKPAFLHLAYFRFLEHVGVEEDFSAGYRARPSEEEIKRLDPIIRYERYLLDSGIGQTELENIKSELIKKIDKSVEAAKAAPLPSKDELLTDVFV